MIDLQLGAHSKSPPVSFSKDTDENKFEMDVLVQSMAKPVIVDFWSPRSAVCKQIMPVLEKLVNAAAGAVLLVRVDVDRNPALAQALRIQSVPTIYAFFQGKPIDGFAGTKTEPELSAFIDKLKQLAGAAPPMGEDNANAAEQIKKFMAEGDDFFKQGSLEDAMSRYSSALELDPANMEALGGIGWCLLTQGDSESVRELLSGLTPDQVKSPRLQGLKFILSLSEKTAGLENAEALEKKAQKNPKDIQALYDLALQYLAGGKLEQGIDTLITLIRLNREWQEQKARLLLLQVFEALGNAHPLTLSGRRKLSSVLFS
jgi:putative thioredoxin